MSHNAYMYAIPYICSCLGLTSPDCLLCCMIYLAHLTIDGSTVTQSGLCKQILFGGHFPHLKVHTELLDCRNEVIW